MLQLLITTDRFTEPITVEERRVSRTSLHADQHGQPGVDVQNHVQWEATEELDV